MTARTLIERFSAPEHDVRLVLDRLVHDAAWFRAADGSMTLDVPRVWEWRDRRFDLTEATEVWWLPGERVLAARTFNQVLAVELAPDGALASHQIFRIRGAG